MRLVASLGGGHGVPPGTPAFSHPWENAARAHGLVGILRIAVVASVRSGRERPSGTPAFFRPWKNAARAQSAPGILPAPIAATRRRTLAPAANAWHDGSSARSAS